MAISMVRLMSFKMDPLDIAGLAGAVLSANAVFAADDAAYRAVFETDDEAAVAAVLFDAHRIVYAPARMPPAKMRGGA